MRKYVSPAGSILGAILETRISHRRISSAGSRSHRRLHSHGSAVCFVLGRLHSILYETSFTRDDESTSWKLGRDRFPLDHRIFVKRNG